MANLELISPQKTATFSFATAPAHNLLCSLFLLNEDKDEISEWVTQTKRRLTNEQLEANKLTAALASRFLGGTSWESFSDWITHLEGYNAIEMRDWMIEDFRKACGQITDTSLDDLPTAAAILADEEIYLALYEEVYIHKSPEKKCDCDAHRKEFQLYQQPNALKELLVSHLTWMWNEFYQNEWQRALPLLEDSIQAFQSVQLFGNSTEDALRSITGREQMPQIWDHWIATVENVIVIPSIHIGPYLMTIDKTENTVWLIVRAHIPEGASVSSPSLTRSELLMRLSALSNETRLQILELLNTKGELNASDIQNQLELTQSATSRHIQQLFATGYLHQRRLEGVKHYRIHHQRIANTAKALTGFLQK